MQIAFLVGGTGGVGEIAQQHLEKAGFLVHALSAESNIARRALQIHPFIILIDTAALGRKGLQLCQLIRATPALARTPVVLLAAKASEDERIAGLEAGADDYISEFSRGREFVARMQAVIRRFARLVPCPGIPQPFAFVNFLAGSASSFRAGDIEIDPSAMKILVRGSEVPTTALEFRLLYYLSHHRTCVFSRDQLLDAVWGTQYVGPRTVDACVRRLRSKIEPDRSSPIYLKTIRGAGYRLETGVSEA